MSSSAAGMNANQTYTGIEEQDVAIFDKYRNHSVSPSPGFYTDFSGVKTRLSYFDIGDSQLDKTVGDPPFPDDKLHAEAIEYVAALHAVETSQSSFTAVELGAGYAPWLTFSAKAAQRAGIHKINLLAVEADLARHELIRTHLGDNGLPVPGEDGIGMIDEVESRLIHGAVSDFDGMVSFGSQSITDWGSAPIEDGGTVDYRGLETKASPVRAYTIESVLQDIPAVDFLHMDIQGCEANAVRASLGALLAKVRVMLIATHSRQIEGELFALLFGNGWRILFEKPCKFERREAANLESLTNVDGTQVWLNVGLATRQPANAISFANGASGREETRSLNRELITLRERASQLEEKLKEADEKLHDAHESIAALRTEVADLKSSTSWKVTAPMRKLRTVLR